MAECNTPAQLPCGPGPFSSPICYNVPPVVSLATAGLTLAVTVAGELSVNANPGVAGQVLASQGPGLPPVWA